MARTQARPYSPTHPRARARVRTHTHTHTHTHTRRTRTRWLLGEAYRSAESARAGETEEEEGLRPHERSQGSSRGARDSGEGVT